MNHGIFRMMLDALTAYNQIGYIFGGMMCLAFGGGMVCWFIYGHLTGKRIRGKVISVRVIDRSAVMPANFGQSGNSYSGDMYYAVYEYTGPDGKVYQGGDGSGSSGLADRIPGTPVWLYVNPRHPEKIMRAGLLWLIFGVVFAAPGVVLLDIAFTHFKFNIFTLLIPLAVMAHVFFRIKSKFKPHELHDKVTQLMADAKAYREAPGQPAASTMPAGRELTRDEIKVRLQAMAKTNRLATPILSLVAVVLMVVGFHLGQSMAALLATGHRADGNVVRVESVYSSGNHGGYTYYPVVGFALPDGTHREFRDRIGSNPPLQAAGEKVTVLYDPAKPEQAMIDRGIWNWALSGGLMLGGFVLLLMVLKSLSNARRPSRL
jgi:hypothetical protein